MNDDDDEINENTIDISKWASSSFNWAGGTSGAQGTYTVSALPGGSTGSSSPYTFTTGSAYSIPSYTNSSLNVTGDAIFDGDIKWKGRSLGTLLEKIEERLSILQPDPEKLEKFAALKASYEHYKLLEALCSGDIPKGTKDE